MKTLVRLIGLGILFLYGIEANDWNVCLFSVVGALVEIGMNLLFHKKSPPPYSPGSWDQLEDDNR